MDGRSEYIEYVPHLRRSLAVLVLAAVLTATGVATWETIWRQAGYAPLLYDDMALWSGVRSRVGAAPGKTPVVFVGASRIQVAVDSEVFRARAPGYEPYMLATYGEFPVAVLTEIIRTMEPGGIVIADLDGRALAPTHHGQTQKYVEFYRQKYGPQRRIERALRTRFQRAFIFTGPDFNFVRRVVAWLRGAGWPPKRNFRLNADRTMEVDYASYHRHRLPAFYEGLETEYRERLATPPEEWLASLQPLIEAIQAYQVRGGRVVLLRMPSTGRYYSLDEEYFPQAAYWDRLVATSGATSIRFENHPLLQNFDLHDDSHVDRGRREAFTRALVRILESVGVLEDDASAPAG